MAVGRIGTAVSLVALLAAGAAVGARSLTTASGDVQACVGKANGQVRIVNEPSDCRNSETSRSWPGSASAGPAAYAHNGTAPVHVLNPANPGPGPYTLVGSLSVPAGQYLVDAKLVVSNQTAFHTAVRCVLRAPSNSTVDEAMTYVQPADGTLVHVQTLALQRALSLSAPAVVELRCLPQSVTGAPAVIASEIKIAALTVGSLVLQP